MTTPLWRRCVLHAARSPAHVLGGAMSGLLAALGWNPLPLALFAVASGLWLLHAATSVEYARKVIAAEARERERLARQERAARADALTLQLSQPELARALPDYASRYRELDALAERIRRDAAERPELALAWTVDLEQELARLLSTYLELAQARAQQLDALGGATAQARIAEAGVEIARVERLLAHEPAAAEIRRSHVEVLQRRKAQLEACAARDLRLAAQLDALPDVFRFLHERVSGADVDSTAIREYLGCVVAQVEDVRREPSAPLPVH